MQPIHRDWRGLIVGAWQKITEVLRRFPFIQRTPALFDSAKEGCRVLIEARPLIF